MCHLRIVHIRLRKRFDVSASARTRGDIKYSVVVVALSHNYYVLRRSLHLFLHHSLSRVHLCNLRS